MAVSVATPCFAQDVEVAPADDPTLARIEGWSADLGADDEETRAAAAAALRALEVDALPAIRARLAATARGRPPANWSDDLLHRFHRHANGDEGETTDLADGALVEIGQPHAREDEHGYAIQLAETLFLFRALQAMDTVEAQREAVAIVALDEGRWMSEARNWVRRDGVAVMAAALEARAHEDRRVRSWSRWAIEELGADDPGRAVQRVTRDQLPDLIRAYASLRMQSAMRVIVSYVDHEHRRVRRAAREAMETYGGNSIWVLRTAYRNRTGDHPPREWGWQRVSAELYAHADAQRTEAIREALEQGAAARARGDLDAMARHYDDVLARAVEVEDAGAVAEGYAALGTQALEAGRTAPATRGFRRALRLAPTHPRARAWRAELAFAEAQGLRADGLLDVAAYERVSTLAGEHEGAAEVLRGASSPTVSAPARPRTVWAFVAAALLALLGVVMSLPGRRAVGALDDAHAETLDAPTFDDPALTEAADITLADSTMPG